MRVEGPKAVWIKRKGQRWREYGTTRTQFNKDSWSVLAVL